MDLLPGLLDVVGDLLERVRRAAEPGEELGAVGLGAEQVVELETELLREVADRVVSLVDQLATVLGELSVCERASQRPAAASDPVGRLVDVGGVAGLLQPVRAGQAGEAGSDDDDARCRRRARGGRETAECRDAERSRSGAPKQCPPGRPALLGRGDLDESVLDHLSEWRSHRLPSVVACSLRTMIDLAASFNPSRGGTPSARGATVSGLVGRPGGGSVAL